MPAVHDDADAKVDRLFRRLQDRRLVGQGPAYRRQENAYRLRERSEPNNRITYRKRQEIVYASTNANQRRWYEVDTGLIIRQLDIAEDRMVQVINANRDVFADLMRAHDPNSPPKA